MAFDPATYEPSADFNTAYEAANKRLMANFAQQRGQQNQAIASRGVATSGVASIPGEQLDRAQSEAQAGLIGGLAQSQAQNTIEDRRLKERMDFERSVAENQINAQNTIARRQMQGQLIGGGIGAIGSYFMGAGGAAAPAIAPTIAKNIPYHLQRQ